MADESKRGQNESCAVQARTTKQSIAKFFIDDENVIVTDSYTYLGVLLTQHMDYKLTAGQLARSASRAASKLISIYFENKGLPWRVFTHVHNSVVSPVMDYASAIWGQKRYGVCDEIRRRLIRCFLGVGKKCPISSMEGDMGWLHTYVTKWKQSECGATFVYCLLTA